MEIGNTIKELRKKKKLSQTELARLCGISQTSLSQIETDVSRPSRKTLEHICQVLEIPEQLIYLLSLEKEDIPDDKKDLYPKLFPVVKDMMLSLFYSEPNSISE